MDVIYLFVHQVHREVTSTRIAKGRCQIDQNQMNFLYFHVNNRFIVLGFLKYFPLIHYGSWDHPIFEMTILLIFKKNTIFITIRSRPYSRKSVRNSKSHKMPLSFWFCLKANTIWKLLEAISHWSPLILGFLTIGKKKKFQRFLFIS